MDILTFILITIFSLILSAIGIYLTFFTRKFIALLYKLRAKIKTKMDKLLEWDTPTYEYPWINKVWTIVIKILGIFILIQSLLTIFICSLSLLIS